MQIFPLLIFERSCFYAFRLGCQKKLVCGANLPSTNSLKLTLHKQRIHSRCRKWRTLECLAGHRSAIQIALFNSAFGSEDISFSLRIVFFRSEMFLLTPFSPRCSSQEYFGYGTIFAKHSLVCLVFLENFVGRDFDSMKRKDCCLPVCLCSAFLEEEEKEEEN